MANVDAHVSVPAATVTEPGRMVMVMGTSICHMVLGDHKAIVEGMCGVVEDGILPGLFGYEAGQSGGGRHLRLVRRQPRAAASIHARPSARASTCTRCSSERPPRSRPGESGLVALDWWNGNRSILVDVDLSGLLVGATLATTAPEIYRALIEATAYGTRMIIESFESSGVPIRDLVACGGLPERNRLLMQIYADVTKRRDPRGGLTADAGPRLGDVRRPWRPARRRVATTRIEDAAARMAHLRDERLRAGSRPRRPCTTSCTPSTASSTTTSAAAATTS